MSMYKNVAEFITANLAGRSSNDMFFCHSIQANPE